MHECLGFNAIPLSCHNLAIVFNAKHFPHKAVMKTETDDYITFHIYIIQSTITLHIHVV